MLLACLALISMVFCCQSFQLQHNRKGTAARLIALDPLASTKGFFSCRGIQCKFRSKALSSASHDRSDLLVQRDPPKLAYVALWVGFFVVAFFLVPGGSPASSAQDTELIKALISEPFGDKVNSLYAAIFNFLGILPAIYAGLLIPGAKGQKLPTGLFTALSFALGFGALGPYLAFRNINTEVTQTSRGRGSAAFEFKGTWIAALGFATCLVYHMFSSMANQGSATVLSDFVNLCATSKLSLVSTIDFAILSLAVSKFIHLLI